MATISRIFQDFPLAIDNTVELTVSASHHLSRVMRIQPGEQIILFNGLGGQYRAIIKSISKKSMLVDIIEFFPIERESALKIHLGQVISRGERMDYTIQKAVELGVHTITPLFSERCTVKLTADRLENRMNHWQSIIISACEQCGRNRVPNLMVPIALKNWLYEKHDGLCLVLDPQPHSSNRIAQPLSEVTLLIGAEGGLSDSEILLSKDHGFLPLTLGPRILRTETAAVTALAVCQDRWGDFQQ